MKFCKEGEKPTKRQRTMAKALWLISTARNAIVVVVCSTIAYKLESSSAKSPFKLTGQVRPGLPSFGVPPFSTVVIILSSQIDKKN